jgi:hypothetical protein
MAEELAAQAEMLQNTIAFFKTNATDQERWDEKQGMGKAIEKISDAEAGKPPMNDIGIRAMMVTKKKDKALLIHQENGNGNGKDNSKLTGYMLDGMTSGDKDNLDTEFERY